MSTGEIKKHAKRSQTTTKNDHPMTFSQKFFFFSWNTNIPTKIEVKREKGRQELTEIIQIHIHVKGGIVGKKTYQYAEKALASMEKMKLFQKLWIERIGRK